MGRAFETIDVGDQLLLPREDVDVLVQIVKSELARFLNGRVDLDASLLNFDFVSDRFPNKYVIVLLLVILKLAPPFTQCSNKPFYQNLLDAVVDAIH